MSTFSLWTRCALAAGLLALGGCYTVDQERFAGFVRSTVTPGMPMDQVRHRMAVEGFSCETGAEAGRSVCTRIQQRAISWRCTEQVELARRGAVLGSVEIAPITCSSKW
ncbi:hypothetical protein HSX11_29870 [Oxalobacteraceae bacterium]|nr:hypothetical protein [Oxalobacteraceae bacterium]